MQLFLLDGGWREMRKTAGLASWNLLSWISLTSSLHTKTNTIGSAGIDCISTIVCLCGPVQLVEIMHYIALICRGPKQLQQFLPFTNLSLSSFLLPYQNKAVYSRSLALLRLPSTIKSIPIELVTYCLIYSMFQKKLNCPWISALKSPFTSLSSTDGVEQCGQDEERQGVEKRVWGDQEDLP